MFKVNLTSTIQKEKAMTGRQSAYKNLALIILEKDGFSDFLPLRESDFQLVNHHIATHLEYKQFRSVLKFFGLLDGQNIPDLKQVKRVLASKTKKGTELNQAVQRLKVCSRSFLIENLTRSGLEARLAAKEKELAEAYEESTAIESEKSNAVALLNINSEILRTSKNIEEVREQHVSNLLQADISHLEMGVRATRCLRENGINKVIDLIRKTQDEIKAYPQFGRGSMYILLDTLRKAGLALAKEPWENVSKRSNHGECVFL